MAVEFFPWWTPEAQQRAGSMRIEDVMIVRFSTNVFQAGVLPVNWLPTDTVTHEVLFADSDAFLRIYRLDGEVDLDNARIIHRVQFAAISESSEVSKRIMALVQWVLYAYKDTSYVFMPDGSKVAVRFLRETMGPILDPQQIRDARLVPMTVELETPWPKGLPDLRQHLVM